MVYLGIDYGERRIGLSHGDDLGVAFPEAAATGETEEERLSFIGQLIEHRGVDVLILGMPYHMNGSKGAKAREVEAFADRLREKFDRPVEFVDERLTSEEARKRLGKKLGSDRASRQSGVLDSAAATLILQDYLDQKIPLEIPEEEF